MVSLAYLWVPVARPGDCADRLNERHDRVGRKSALPIHPFSDPRTFYARRLRRTISNVANPKAANGMGSGTDDRDTL